MKEKILLLIFTLCSLGMWGQTAKETTTTLSKNTVPAYTVTYDISSSELQDILDNYFTKELKFKKLKGQGFTQYKGVQWDEVSQEKVDVYYTVSGGKKNGTITLMVSKGYDNFVSGASDAGISNNVIRFLQSLQAQIDKANNQKLVEAQKEKVKDESEKLEDLQKEKNKIEENIKEANQKLEQIKDKIKKQEELISKSKETLIELEKK